MEKPIKAFITEITFNDGEKLTINQNDIVLFVGPNNVGKSQREFVFYECSQSGIIENKRIVRTSGI